MIRKYHNHKLQTNPWHREEEPHNNHETPGRQQSKFWPLSGRRRNKKERKMWNGLSVIWHFIQNIYQKVSEYDQEKPQSQTADQPPGPTHGIMRKRHRTQTVTTQIKKSNQPFFLSKNIAKLEKTLRTISQNKNSTQNEPEWNLNAFYWPNRRAIVSFLLVVRPMNGVGVHRVAKAQVCVWGGGGGKSTRGHTHHTPLSLGGGGGWGPPTRKFSNSKWLKKRFCCTLRPF